jgi:hypothetical protein
MFMTDNGFYEFESFTITLPKNMLLGKKVAEVSRQISEWLESFEEPFNHKTLRLRKIEERDKDYIYHYEIQIKTIDEKISR